MILFVDVFMKFFVIFVVMDFFMWKKLFIVLGGKMSRFGGFCN